jgi:thiosulfate reductase/polysulfide reductase chain A
VGVQFTADLLHAKMVVLVGNHSDASRPALIDKLVKARENGTRFVLIDPRLNNIHLTADEWLAPRPGTELAVLLGIAHILVTEGRYDKAYVAEQGEGFEEWKAALVPYTPEWTEKISGVDASVLQNVARELAEAAPAVCIEGGWDGVLACQYDNSTDTARAIALLNALLGAYNAKGGAQVTSGLYGAPLDPAIFMPVPEPSIPLLGLADYPLIPPYAGNDSYLAQAAVDGRLKGMIFYNSNFVEEDGNPAFMHEALSALDLCVVIDVQMNETGSLAHYFLPECSYLERNEVPDIVGGTEPFAALRNRVLDLIHPDTKPCDLIFSELAAACGLGDYFSFSLDELSAAQIDAVGGSFDDLKASGV